MFFKRIKQSMLFPFSLQYIKIIKVQQSKALYPDKNFKFLVTHWDTDSHLRGKGSLIFWGQKHLFAHSVFSPIHCYADPGERDQTPQAALLHMVTAEQSQARGLSGPVLCPHDTGTG